MGNSRDIKRRLQSVHGTQKITRAIQLVASVKTRKASQAVLATRPYADHAWELLLNVAKRTETHHHPLLRRSAAPKKIAVVIIASNRGLVGSFNSQITAVASEYIRQHKESILAEVETIIMGSKGRAIYYQHGHEIAAEFMKQELVFNAVEVQPMAKLLIDGFIQGQYDRVVVGYMDFVSTLVQKPRIRQILPLNPEDFAQEVSGIVDRQEREEIVAEAKRETASFEYLFEPNSSTVLDALLPRLVEMQIYRAVLESNASEHAARMVAMQNATDAADDLIENLTLTFNQARQAAITQDLAEISAGRAALES